VWGKRIKDLSSRMKKGPPLPRKKTGKKQKRKGKGGSQVNSSFQAAKNYPEHQPPGGPFPKKGKKLKP